MEPGPFFVLLVEDDVNDEALVHRALRSMEPNCIVLVARDGSEAIDYLFRTGPFEGLKTQPRPDLVILDLKLPKVGGLEVLKKIRENNTTSLLPVVVFSSSAEATDVDASYRLGVNSYVHKPLDYDEFIEAVRLIGRYWLGFSRRTPHSIREDEIEPIEPPEPES
ncbi:MAG TPA: response regulator [Fimbriimonadaceae bacterium]|nr:response regulator [Fimbriimonadaceae bacterium]